MSFVSGLLIIIAGERERDTKEREIQKRESFYFTIDDFLGAGATERGRERRQTKLTFTLSLSSRYPSIESEFFSKSSVPSFCFFAVRVLERERERKEGREKKKKKKRTGRKKEAVRRWTFFSFVSLSFSLSQSSPPIHFSPRGVVPLRHFAFSPRTMWGLAMRAPSMVSDWSRKGLHEESESDQLAFQASLSPSLALPCFFATDDFRSFAFRQSRIPLSYRRHLPPFL